MSQLGARSVRRVLAAAALGVAGVWIASGFVTSRGGHAYPWYAAWLAVGVVMVAVGRWWPRPGSERRRSSGSYLFLLDAFGSAAPTLAILAILSVLASMLGGFVAPAAALALLGGAGLLLGSA